MKRLPSLLAVAIVLLGCGGAAKAPETPVAAVDGAVVDLSVPPPPVPDAPAKPPTQTPAEARAAALREASDGPILALIAAGDGTLAANLFGDGSVDASGTGGLGVAGVGGVGTGGGGTGQGIGLGSIGTLGHGSGTGQGYGSGTAPTVRGSLAPEVIRAVIQKSSARLRACYEKGLKTNPELAGKVIARFTIDANGAVTAMNSDGTTLKDPAVLACVTAHFKALTFPKPAGGPVTVTYPLAFSPEN